MAYSVPKISTSDFQSEVGEVFGGIGGELPRRSLEGDFRASCAGENRQKHFPPKPHRKFHHQLKEKKPPKIRKKKFPGTKFLGTFGPPPTEKTEKIGKIKGTLVRKVPGNLRSQEFVFFFLVRFFCPLIKLHHEVLGCGGPYKEGPGL